MFESYRKWCLQMVEYDCVCMNVCVYVSMYVWKYVCICAMCIRVYEKERGEVWMWVCMCVWGCMCVCLCIIVCVHYMLLSSFDTLRHMKCLKFAEYDSLEWINVLCAKFSVCICKWLVKEYESIRKNVDVRKSLDNSVILCGKFWISMLKVGRLMFVSV